MAARGGRPRGYDGWRADWRSCERPRSHQLWGCALYLLVGSTNKSGLRSPRQVTLTVRVVGPRPDPDNTANPLGRRQREVGFQVAVAADLTCDELRYSYRTTDLFGRPAPPGSRERPAAGAGAGSVDGPPLLVHGVVPLAPAALDPGARNRERLSCQLGRRRREPGLSKTASAGRPRATASAGVRSTSGTPGFLTPL